MYTTHLLALSGLIVEAVGIIWMIRSTRYKKSSIFVTYLGLSLLIAAAVSSQNQLAFIEDKEAVCTSCVRSGSHR